MARLDQRPTMAAEDDGADAAADGAAAAVAFGNAKVTDDEPTEEDNEQRFAELNKQVGMISHTPSRPPLPPPPPPPPPST